MGHISMGVDFSSDTGALSMEKTSPGSAPTVAPPCRMPKPLRMSAVFYHIVYEYIDLCVPNIFCNKMTVMTMYFDD